ncbi:MAG: sugar transferase [Acidobacteria bacterium]|nr:sugar transferase [Acidobacteriota bacterium]
MRAVTGPGADGQFGDGAAHERPVSGRTANAPVAVGAGSSEVSAWARSPWKRVLDLTVALPLAVLTLPVLGLLCVGSAVVFRANPLFTQDRIGRDGRIFRFVKLRSLPVSVPADIDKYALATRPLGRWARFVRRTHLDELPQLWLVVAGRMSLVGPRPELPAIAATFDPDFVRRRVRVRPGVTGPWQVGTAAAGLIGESPEFDDLYVTAVTLRLDLWVLGRTVATSMGAAPVSFEACARVVSR